MGGRSPRVSDYHGRKDVERSTKLRFAKRTGQVLGCPLKLGSLVSKLVYFAYLGDVSNLLTKGH